MSDAISDIVNFSNAFGGLANSLTQLHNVRVQKAAQKEALNMEKAQYGFLERFNLPMGDGRRLDSMNWRDAYNEYKAETDGYLSEVKDPSIREGVQSALLSSENAFRTNLANRLAIAEKQEAQAISYDGYMTTLTLTADKNYNYARAKEQFDKDMEMGLWSPSDAIKIKNTVLAPAFNEAYYQGLMNAVPTERAIEVPKEDGTIETQMVSVNRYAMASRENSSRQTVVDQGVERPRTMAEINAVASMISAQQAAHDKEAKENFKVFEDASKQGLVDFNQLEQFWAQYGSDLSESARIELATKTMQYNSEITAADATLWVADAEKRYGRGISEGTASVIKGQFTTYLENKYGQIQVDGVWTNDKARKEYEDGISKIDSWKRSSEEGASSKLNSFQAMWVQMRRAGQDSATSNYQRYFGYYDLANWAMTTMRENPDVPGLANYLDNQLSDLRKEMSANSPFAKLEESVKVVSKDQAFIAVAGSGAASKLSSLVSVLDKPEKWTTDNAKAFTALQDAMKRAERRALDTKTDGDQAKVMEIFKEEIIAGFSSEAFKATLDIPKDSLFTTVEGAYGRGYALAEKIPFDASKSVSTQGYIENVQSWVRENVVGKLAASGSIPPATDLIEKKIGNDLFYLDKSGFVYAVDSIGNRVVMRKSTNKPGANDNYNNLNYGSPIGGKPADKKPEVTFSSAGAGNYPMPSTFYGGLVTWRAMRAQGQGAWMQSNGIAQLPAIERATGRTFTK